MCPAVPWSNEAVLFGNCTRAKIESSDVSNRRTETTFRSLHMTITRLTLRA
jgi:hypothetical protein